MYKLSPIPQILDFKVFTLEKNLVTFIGNLVDSLCSKINESQFLLGITR